MSLVLVLLAGVCVSLKTYDNKKIVGEVELHWTIAGQFIHLGLKAKTTGWIGFGIGEDTSGSMPGADFLIGQVVNGVPSVNDYHAEDSVTPTKDALNHWKLLAGAESGGYTEIEVQRYLDTKDDQDRPIYNAKHLFNNILTATGSSDTLSQHSGTQKTSRVSFGVKNGDPEDALAAIKADCCGGSKTYDSIWIANKDVTMNFAGGDGITYYHEVNFDLNTNSTFDNGVSIVGFETHLDAKTSKFVHHFVLLPRKGGAKLNKNWWAWVPGMVGKAMPNDVGFLLGKGKDVDGLTLQTHFDNSAGTKGVNPSDKDNSGINVFFTKTLRKYEADMLTLGDPTVKLSSEADDKKYLAEKWSKHTFTCPSSETSKFSGDITMLYFMHHMHATGRQMLTQQTRSGTKVDEWRTDYYNWKMEQVTWHNKTLKKGDELTLQCVFYNDKGDKKLKWGQGSGDEMCMDFIIYYPRQTTMEVGCGYPDSSKKVVGTYEKLTLDSTKISSKYDALQLSSFGTAGKGSSTVFSSFSAAPSQSATMSVTILLLTLLAAVVVLY
jgi:hypothetical protein